MSLFSEEDFQMMREHIGIDDLDIKIIKSFGDREKPSVKYISTVMLYNAVNNFYKNTLRFIFITIPVFIAFPIWKLVFDAYRSVMELRLNGKSKQD